MCFTTGRGSAFGSKPTPCLKLATNNTLWVRQQEDMDINCGDVVEGKETIAEAGERLYAMILEMASGKKLKVNNLDMAAWSLCHGISAQSCNVIYFS
ncbi:UxaA family hydrolase [Yersinia intermedia]|nr:UxaA family hydrolase [Yersinia intermedia]